MTSGPPRALADDGLRPAAWTPTVAALAPVPRPPRERRPFDFAPAGFVASPAFPPQHPFARTLREPLPPAPAARPLGYLGPPRPSRPVAIALGGADASRPNPLSGPVVGGGPAPIPAPKPDRDLPVAAAIHVQPIDPAAVVEHAQAVRQAADVPRQADNQGVP